MRSEGIENRERRCKGRLPSSNDDELTAFSRISSGRAVDNQPISTSYIRHAFAFIAGNFTGLVATFYISSLEGSLDQVNTYTCLIHIDNNQRIIITFGC